MQKAKLRRGHILWMILPPIVANQNFTENLKFKIQPGHGKMIAPPLSPTRISLEILNLRFSLDMERWLTPPIVTDHNLTENFKFKI